MDNVKYRMAAIKRRWIPEWFYALMIRSFLRRLCVRQPLRWLLHQDLEREQRCDEPGCEHPAVVDCFFPENDDQRPDFSYCSEHAYAAGFCWGCGNFWTGVETFDFLNPSRLCDNCRTNSDLTGEYPEDDEWFENDPLEEYG